MRQLCNGHPHISMLSELGCCDYLGLPRRLFLWRLLGLLKRRGSLPPLHRQPRDRSWSAAGSKALFLVRFARAVWNSSASSGIVGGPELEAALRSLFPGSSVVGDKYPDYVFDLQRWERWDNLRCLVMIRDPRDVAASTLERVKHRWRGAWTEALDSPAKIARRWVNILESLPAEGPRLQVVHYEDLVQRPESVAERLGSWLQVSPGEFPLHLVHGDSVGNFQKSLSAADCKQILAIAGNHMGRYGHG